MLSFVLPSEHIDGSSSHQVRRWYFALAQHEVVNDQFGNTHVHVHAIHYSMTFTQSWCDERTHKLSHNARAQPAIAF